MCTAVSLGVFVFFRKVFFHSRVAGVCPAASGKGLVMVTICKRDPNSNQFRLRTYTCAVCSEVQNVVSQRYKVIA